MRWLRWLALGLSGLMGCSAAEVPPHVLGAVLPLSGAEKSLGESYRRGMSLAVDGYNQGEKFDGRGICVLLAHSDGSAEMANRAALRLISINRVQALIGGRNTSEVRGLAQAATSEKLGAAPAVAQTLCVTFTSGVGSTTGPVFSIGPTPKEQGRALGIYAAENLKAQRAVLWSQEGWVNAPEVVSGFRASFVSEGRSVVSEETFAQQPPVGKPDPTVGEPADVYLLVSPKVEKTLPSKAAFLQVSEDSLRTGPDGRVVVTDWSPNEADWPAWAATYREKYGVPPDAEAARGYEAMQAILEAAKRAKSFATHRLREELAKSPIRKTLYVVRVEPQGPTLLRRVEPAD